MRVDVVCLKAPGQDTEEPVNAPQSRLAAVQLALVLVAASHKWPPKFPTRPMKGKTFPSN